MACCDIRVYVYTWFPDYAWIPVASSFRLGCLVNQVEELVELRCDDNLGAAVL